MRRAQKGKVPHQEGKYPLGFGVGFGGVEPNGEGRRIRINLDDLSASLPSEIQNPLRAHLNTRRRNYEAWGGEPSLGLILSVEKPIFVRGNASIELTIDTVDENDGLVWMHGFRQGIRVESGKPVHLMDRWLKGRLIDFDAPKNADKQHMDSLLQYIKTANGFALARILAQAAESVIVAKLPQPTK